MLEIIPFCEANRRYIRELNVEWLARYFSVEPGDEVQLGDPEKEIIGPGGSVFYARIGSQIVGTVALMRIDDATFELSKMAVTETMQGKGIGRALMEHCLTFASQNGIRKLVLFSNTKLEAAIALYRKYGFSEVPLGSTHYRRANIRMELLVGRQLNNSASVS